MNDAMLDVKEKTEANEVNEMVQKTLSEEVVEQSEKMSSNPRKDYEFTAWIDGSCQGNPGPIGIGYSIVNKDKVQIAMKSKRIDRDGTNNMAEYLALIDLLNFSKKQGILSLRIFCDSKVVVEQVNGVFSPGNNHLLKFLEYVKAFRQCIDFKIIWIPREKNSVANALSKQAFSSTKNKMVDDLLTIYQDSSHNGATIIRDSSGKIVGGEFRSGGSKNEKEKSKGKATDI